MLIYILILTMQTTVLLNTNIILYANNFIVYERVTKTFMSVAPSIMCYNHK